MTESVAARSVTEAVGTRARLAFIDNLRWTMILLVISMHAADTYSPLGNWYYVDRSPLSTPVLLTFAAWQTYLQSFFMGLLFFVAGVFVPASFDKKGPRLFLRDRAFRLGMPVLLYTFAVGPFTEYFVSHSWTASDSTFAREWWIHLIDGEFLGMNGPLWFCLALLIFSTVYAALRMWREATPPAPESDAPPGTAALVCMAFAIAGAGFALRVVLPSGLTIMNMHVSDFSQYIALFIAGIVVARHGWLPKLSFALGMRWLLIVLPIGFAAWLALFASRSSTDRWHWQAAGFAVWESFTGVALSFGLLVLYRERFNTQGRLARYLSDNAFAVYVFHPPIVIMGARIMHGTTWPPLVKFVLLTVFAVVVTFVLSSAAVRRIPLLRAIV